MKTTLKARLIILMVVSSIFLISTFTAIQLNNQLRRTADFNLYQARLVALTAKDRIQDLFSSITPDEPSYITSQKVGKVFSSLKDLGVIESAVLLDPKGKPIASKGEIELESRYDKQALGAISQMQAQGIDKWLFPFVDKKNRIITLFIRPEGSKGYTIRLKCSLGNMQEAINEVYFPVVITIIIVVLGNIGFATLFSRALIHPVKILNDATKDIAGGNLDMNISIKTGDELEELSDTFNYMTAELKKMRAKAENANPLTKLPGNIVIQEETEKRIKDGKKFVLIYSDLDNFKAFNDKYGVHAGDKAIGLTAGIFKEAISKFGAKDDFIGHEGGDDFLLLTTPERMDKLAAFITSEFDKNIRQFYSKEDLERGYIEAKARHSEEVMKFPVMTISLAGVSNINKPIESYAQVTNIAAEVKKAAKNAKGSELVLDRRKNV